MNFHHKRIKRQTLRRAKNIFSSKDVETKVVFSALIALETWKGAAERRRHRLLRFDIWAAGVVRTWAIWLHSGAGLSSAEEKPFGASVARILESQRAAQAICNPQCEQIEDHFKYSHSHVIAREMEADLSSCFSAILRSTGQPGSLNNEPRDKPPSKRTSVCFQGFIDIQCLLQLFLPL